MPLSSLWTGWSVSGTAFPPLDRTCTPMEDLQVERGLFLIPQAAPERSVKTTLKFVLDVVRRADELGTAAAISQGRLSLSSAGSWKRGHQSLAHIVVVLKHCHPDAEESGSQSDVDGKNP